MHQFSPNYFHPRIFIQKGGEKKEYHHEVGKMLFSPTVGINSIFTHMVGENANFTRRG